MMIQRKTRTISKLKLFGPWYVAIGTVESSSDYVQLICLGLIGIWLLGELSSLDSVPLCLVIFDFFYFP